ncbi:DUF4870 domain-containing protein [Candidatus Falkowbacteria bacterium]|nr:DUF4870 domain-containing protein [Candidatus Falkowbacteria bacterium]
MKYTFEERIISAMGYIGILFIVPLFAKKSSAYCQFHGKQGLVLFVAWTLNAIILVIPLLGWLVSFFGSILLFVISAIAVIKAYLGEEWVLPLLGKYAKNLDV